MEDKWKNKLSALWLIFLMVNLMQFISYFDNGSYFLAMNAFGGMAFSCIVLSYLYLPTYQMGINDSWESINSLIISGPLSGDGWDKTAERNGIILAANKLFYLSHKKE